MRQLAPAEQRQRHRQAEVAGVGEDHAADQPAERGAGHPDPFAEPPGERAGDREPEVAQHQPDAGAERQSQMREVDVGDERDQHPQHQCQRTPGRSRRRGGPVVGDYPDRRRHDDDQRNEQHGRNCAC